MKTKVRRTRKRRPFPLRTACRSVGVSLCELARRTKIGRHSLSAIANGRTDPSWQTCCRIAEGLRLNLGHFHPRRARKGAPNG